MPSRRRTVPGALLTAAALALTACTGGQPEIEVAPVDGPFAPLELRVTGLAPGAEVTLTATTLVDDVRLESGAELAADADGVIDLSTTAPTSGSWSTADPLGPFWSMTGGDGLSPSVFDEPYDVALTVVDASGTTLAERRTTRPGTAPGVETRPVEDAGFVGVVRPPGPRGCATPGGPGAGRVGGRPGVRHDDRALDRRPGSSGSRRGVLRRTRSADGAGERAGRSRRHRPRVAAPAGRGRHRRRCSRSVSRAGVSSRCGSRRSTRSWSPAPSPRSGRATSSAATPTTTSRPGRSAGSR